MGKIISYGEDPLTYRALCLQQTEILQKLGEMNAREASLVIYRPSFGRGPGAMFGEFDGIMATDQTVYLIESKWDRSSEGTTSIISLQPKQVLRHRIFRWYLRTWRSLKPQHWGAFMAAAADEFVNSFPRKKLAPPGSDLQRNLQFILQKLAPFGSEIVDVVLHFARPTALTPLSVEPSSFRLVTLEYEGMDGSGYFEMPG